MYEIIRLRWMITLTNGFESDYDIIQKHTELNRIGIITLGEI